MIPSSTYVRAVSAEQVEAGSNRLRQQRGNYFARHWRGDLSLGISYWGNGFLASVVVGVAARVVAGLSVDLRTRMTLSVLILALAIGASVWHLVGVWRSASNHYDRGGRRFWAGAAKLMVLISL